MKPFKISHFDKVHSFIILLLSHQIDSKNPKLDYSKIVIWLWVNETALFKSANILQMKAVVT